MRYVKLLGVALIAMCSLGAVSASVSQAVETLPKLLPAGLSFTFSGVAPKLETLGGQAINCEKVKGSGGELAGNESLGKVTFLFENCKDGILGTKCTGLSDTTTGNITVSGAEFHLRHLLEADKSFVNIVILLPGGGVHFTCLGILWVVSGCVASMDILNKENGVNAVGLLLTSAFVNFLQVKVTRVRYW